MSSTGTSQFKSTPTMRAFAAGFTANVPVLLESHPGQAKSSKITATLNKSGYFTKCILGSVREATDFLGLPVEVGTGEQVRVTNVPPDFAVELNAHEKSALFLDEINTSAESTRKAMLRLVQEKFAGDYKINDNVRIVAAQNPPESSVGGVDLDPALANRFLHLDWHFQADEWMRGLVGGFNNLDQPGLDELAYADEDGRNAMRVNAMLASFLQTRSDLLTPEPPTDPYEAGKAWSSPRSWHNVARVLAHVHPADEEAMVLVVNGLVGESASRMLLEWLTIADLHDPQAVLDNPNIVEWSKERPDRLFGLMLAIGAIAASDGSAEVWEKAIRAMTACAEGGRPDVALPGARALLNKRPKDAKITSRTREAFADLLSATRYGFTAA